MNVKFINLKPYILNELYNRIYNIPIYTNDIIKIIKENILNISLLITIKLRKVLLP